MQKKGDIFQGLKQKGKIVEKQLSILQLNIKKTTELGKMYLFPKIHKRLYDLPGKAVISNCGKSKEKAGNFLIRS